MLLNIVIADLIKEVRGLVCIAVPAKLTMSANLNARRAAGHGRGGRGRGRVYPAKKGFISAHTDDVAHFFN